MTNDDKVIAVLRVFAKIADRFDANGLDEARPEWEHLRKKPLDPTKTVLLSGRGGGDLLTLQDCFDARESLVEFANYVKRIREEADIKSAYKKMKLAEVDCVENCLCTMESEEKCKYCVQLNAAQNELVTLLQQ